MTQQRKRFQEVTAVQTQVSHNRVPPHMPEPRIGALTNDQRWSYIVESVAQLLADGDRAAQGLRVLPFSLLSEEDRQAYRRHALAGVMPVAYPEFVEACQQAAIHRACEVWDGDGDRPVSRALAGRMRKAWAWGFTYLHSALSNAIPDRQVKARAREFDALLSPAAPTERLQ